MGCGSSRPAGLSPAPTAGGTVEAPQQTQQDAAGPPGASKPTVSSEDVASISPKIQQPPKLHQPQQRQQAQGYAKGDDNNDYNNNPNAATLGGPAAAAAVAGLPLSEEEEEQLLLLLLQKKQRHEQPDKEPHRHVPQLEQSPLQRPTAMKIQQDQQQQQEQQGHVKEQSEMLQAQPQQEISPGTSIQRQRPSPPPPPPEHSEAVPADHPGQRVQDQLQCELQEELQELSQQQEQQLRDIRREPQACSEVTAQQQQQQQDHHHQGLVDEAPGLQEQLARAQEAQQQLQERLAGLSLEQIRILQIKLQERLQRQLQERLQRQQEEKEALAREEEEREAEAARRRQERQQRREQREQMQGQMQAQYEQELLQLVLTPTVREGSAACVSVADAEAMATGVLETCPSAGATAPVIPVRVWSGDAGDGSLLFPELDDLDFKVAGITRKAPLAICISGGDMHSALLGLGWLRALHVMGLLRRAQYICASGSSSLLAALAFHQVEKLDELLGSYIPAEGDNGEAAQRQGDQDMGSMARALAAAVNLLNEWRRKEGASTAASTSAAMASWVRAVDKALLEPLGVGGVEGCSVSLSGTKGHVDETVAKRAAQLGLKLHVANPLLPYPIICQSLQVVQEGVVRYLPYEWTALYGGCPVPYEWTSPKMGGGWVELLGTNAELVSKPPTAAASGCEVHVRPMGPSPSLALAVAISSAAIGSTSCAGIGNGDDASANGAAHVGRALSGAAPPALPPLPPAGILSLVVPYFDQQVWQNSHVGLTDGGCSDRTSIYPALRRRVTNIMSLISCSRGLVGKGTHTCPVARDITALFGRWSGAVDSRVSDDVTSLDEFTRQRQVFRGEALDELLGSLKTLAAAEKPLVHLAKYEVLANPHVGVPGGWTVHVLWVVHQDNSLQGSSQDWPPGDMGGVEVKVQEAARAAFEMLVQNRGHFEAMAGGADDYDDDDDEY